MPVHLPGTPRWTITTTAVGPALIVVSDAGVRSIRFRTTPDAVGLDPTRRDDAGLREVTAALRGLVDGSRRDFPFPLDLDQGTVFERRVWTELLAIPHGTTVTYGELAKRLGLSVAASRAVGRANAKNPLPVVIPCHRVVAADSRLGGYAGGIDIKEHLLRVERAILQTPRVRV
jgi:methylated-DNA-[protein]-cysteine S-methyltransferase